MNMMVVEEMDEDNGLIIPDEFLCPLTLEIMQQPVMTRWGHNFERDVLMKWMQYHNHCPMTRNPISLKDIIVNRALKAKILHWQHEQGQLGVCHHDHNNNATTTTSLSARTKSITKSNDMWLMTMMDHVDLVDHDNSDRNDQILPFLVNVDSPQVLMRALKRSSDPCGKHALQYLRQQQQQQQGQTEPPQQRQHSDNRQQQQQHRRRRRMLQRRRAAFAA